MSLKTGMKLHGHIWTELPISDPIIERVEELGEADGQLFMASGPIFEWTPENHIIDPVEDETALDEVMQNAVYDEQHIQGEDNNDSSQSTSDGLDQHNMWTDSESEDEQQGAVITDEEQNEQRRGRRRREYTRECIGSRPGEHVINPL